MRGVDEQMEALATMSPAQLATEWDRITKGPLPNVSADLLRLAVPTNSNASLLVGLAACPATAQPDRDRQDRDAGTGSRHAPSARMEWGGAYRRRRWPRRDHLERSRMAQPQRGRPSDHRHPLVWPRFLWAAAEGKRHEDPLRGVHAEEQRRGSRSRTSTHSTPNARPARLISSARPAKAGTSCPTSTMMADCPVGRLSALP